MKPSILTLSFLLAAAGLPAWAGPGGSSVASASLHLQAHDAAKGQQVASGEDVRREEAVAGRRLTPTELAELRQQVRQQWASAPEAGGSAELPPAERVSTEPASKGDGLPAPATARP